MPSRRSPVRSASETKTLEKVNDRGVMRAWRNRRMSQPSDMTFRESGCGGCERAAGGVDRRDDAGRLVPARVLNDG
jgi:hypothetical protein